MVCVVLLCVNCDVVLCELYLHFRGWLFTNLHGVFIIVIMYEVIVELLLIFVCCYCNCPSCCL